MQGGVQSSTVQTHTSFEISRFALNFSFFEPWTTYLEKFHESKLEMIGHCMAWIWRSSKALAKYMVFFNVKTHLLQVLYNFMLRLRDMVLETGPETGFMSVKLEKAKLYKHFSETWDWKPYWDTSRNGGSRTFKMILLHKNNENTGGEGDVWNQLLKYSGNNQKLVPIRDTLVKEKNPESWQKHYISILSSHLWNNLKNQQTAPQSGWKTAA